MNPEGNPSRATAYEETFLQASAYMPLFTLETQHLMMGFLNSRRQACGSHEDKV